MSHRADPTVEALPSRLPWRRLNEQGIRLRAFRAAEPAMLGAAGVAIFLAGWQVIAMLGVMSSLVFPSPLATLEALAKLFAGGSIWPHLLASGRLLVLGLAISAVAGVSLGILAGWYRGLRAALSPHVALWYAVPPIALMPLFIVWLGLGLGSQLAIVFLLGFFQCYHAGLDAVRMSDRGLVLMAQSFGARERKLFTSVILPGSVPRVLAGLRQALAKAIVGVMVVELYASNVGLGFLLNFYANRFRTAELFSVIVVVMAVGIISRELIRLVERRFDAWRPIAR